MVTVPESPTTTAHPLDSLSAAEIAEAVAIVRGQRPLGPRTRFVSVALREPTRQELRLYRQGVALERLAEIVLLDNDTGLTSEAIVSLSRGSIADWRDVPGVQPAVMLDEFYECELMVKAGPGRGRRPSGSAASPTSTSAWSIRGRTATTAAPRTASAGWSGR